MRKFIIKITYFTLPFFLLYFITYLFYSSSQSPDLLRLGYIPNIYKNYRSIFPNNNNEKFEKLSDTKNKTFKILTIGDSFSEQGGEGYKNVLANNYSILHVDRFLSNNQFQTLINLINGDFFDNKQFEYVILQCVERYIMDNIENLNFNKKIMLLEIDSLSLKHKKNQKSKKSNYKFFSKATFKIPYSMSKFYFQENYLSNQVVYNVELNSNTLFSNNSSKLLFYYYDLMSTKKSNLPTNAIKLNNILNQIQKKLKEKNVKLLFLPSPDKYDLYYNHIKDKKHFRKPLFFNNMIDLKKDYYYINSKSILSSSSYKDIYYYDDTHWSPIAAKIIAEEISEVIKQIE
ncbi:hypothetical protein R3X25_15090 [Lutibacter sp. TH_r2]|uniref:alginate O-acetyltransferase AlgX-related protein n=1 Tax=Lutibacter sp. TH_r2 TaxID=3082083 RepID=UPI0029556565|nr:hypothetical protein [Lutibacter sp. TH_r2]MDV7188606.1 hypothetical protein [Lutibacter sp. TH_r2]